MTIEPKYSPDFQEFWRNYPSRVSDIGVFVKVGKWDAFVQWRKLTVDVRQKCLMLVRNKMVKCGKFTQDACRFLAHRRWEDYPDYPPDPKPKNEHRQNEPVKLGEIATLKERQEIARKAGIK
jgi:hypothetical protein